MRLRKQRPGPTLLLVVRLKAIKPDIRMGADNSQGGHSLVD